MKTITPEELYQKLKSKENLVILDVRAEEKYNHYHIEASGITNLNINKTEIFNLEENDREEINNLPKDRAIIVTCTTGNSATKCANILAERDYDVVVLQGGITAWKEYSGGSILKGNRSESLWISALKDITKVNFKMKIKERCLL
ncbi:rhodanese-like domain-containing protein [Ureibacillus acetophenoni]|uniref:Rhodanese-related sulfurtransferase n=1 Tax=Ureibacillus acetophenoni TaxID=614649 RepID=A0A285UHZ5_9BACL|nr:rhodanese-like domain-containing protein [Ureibacillus acetophenoni]SOC39871.1 rhodanese-related sulfurtransferase [Ureibacillus acetophenoni]